MGMACSYLNRAEDASADRHFVDLLRPFVDFKDLGSPVEALDGIVIEITISTVKL
jgi:hypothetical protein